MIRNPKPHAPLVLSGRGVTAVLGPTNTGKTHFAIERMLSHATGVIGLPLRLLAREVYTRVCEKVGEANVSLVTGEEKIVPPKARYSVCTVEAMPRETKAAFVAIDEVQLAGDLERGHIFTDRILHLRGREETLLLGAESMRGILEHLLRGINIVTRPRLSQLLFAGQKKITRLPPRSAIVAFSTEEVYAIAELIRRQRGGAAVVTGALSPRTRNAQVELYQSGDVDFLVATDAIGMGLNLDVNHVAFAQTRKFDGWQYRNLNPGELAQVAGRAGRHVRDGTFGTTGQADPFNEELVERIESHYFDPVRVLQWRTAQFDYSSVDSLLASLDTVAPIDGLTRALPSVDAEALNFLIKDEDIRRIADKSHRVETLWDACSLPDYRKIAPAQHAEIVGAIFLDLAKRGHVDEAYMAEQVRRADNPDGDIDALSQRIAQIRTWTYVSHRPKWLAKPLQWQEKTREIENRLSDALHERLTKRFVDRRTSVLMKRLRENVMLEAEITVNGDVLVEGHIVGQLQGFRFSADVSAEGEDGKAIQTAAMKSLAVEYDARAYRFAASANGDISLGSDGYVRWLGAPIATLVASEDFLKPRVVLLADEQLTGGSRDLVDQRVTRFVNYQIEQHLKPLADLAEGAGLEGMAKGLAYRLYEAQGVLKRKDVADDAKALDQEARSNMRKLGIRFGAYHIFLPAMLKPAPAQLVTLLWALKNDAKEKPGYGDVVAALAAGRTSVVADPSFEREFYRIGGFRYLGKRAVRIDILERLADFIRPTLAWKPGNGPRPAGAYDGERFMVTPAMLSILGATMADMEEILKGLGYRSDTLAADEVDKKVVEIDAAVAAAAPAPTTPEVIVERVGRSESAASEEAGAETAEAVATPAAEGAAEEAPKVTLLWKQGKFEPRQNNERGGHRRPQRAPDVTGDAQSNANRGPRRDRNAKGEGEGDGKPRFNRNREGGEGKPRHEGNRDQNRGPKRDGHRDDKFAKGGNKGGKPQNFSSKPREEREPKFDPDSPFAKLAALRDQLKK
ncbi:MAG: helicase-related protein [Rhizobiaceae bacterium]